MPICNLHRIFDPKSVAVIGASDRPLSVGNTVLRNLLEGGFAGSVYPVNPKHQQVLGAACFKTVGDLPAGVDLAVICTPAVTVPQLVRECGEAGIRGLVILSAGFRETSAAGKQLEQDVRKVAQSFDSLRIIGPNCLGIMAPHRSLNASFASDLPPPGNVAFISQSGALCTAILDWAIQEQVGFSHFVSVGNMLDVGIADLIDYFAADPCTDSIILYIESITEAREFMSAARAFTRNKPIIAYKAGRYAESAKAAASHTGAMAGVDSVYEAAMVRAGIVRVFEVDDLFDCAELLSRHKTPTGPRLATVTNAGGPGVMATDSLLSHQGVIAPLSEATLQQLNDFLPAAWSHGNPVDVLGDAPPERFAKAIEIVLADPNVDGVLAILTPQAMTDPTGVAKALVASAKNSRQPVLAVWMGGGKVREAIELLNAAGVATYTTPEKGVRAFMYLVTYARNRETLYETPRDIPLNFSLDRAKLRTRFESVVNSDTGNAILSEPASKALLEAYGIPVTPTLVARTQDAAREIAAQLGFPVVAKIYSRDITHKTDVGGVALNLSDASEVADAWDRMMTGIRLASPAARLEGITLQPMVVEPAGRELIVGAKRDPVFGTVLLVGAGGTTAELFQDRALELPPLSENLARRMLKSLRSCPLLEGYRGRPGVNLDRLVEVLMRLSYLVADHPEITELDVNPLLATPHDVVALDARIVIDREVLQSPPARYSHLAIRPYPVEFTKSVTLKNGVKVFLRPIKPEDEPLWHAFVGRCSTASRHFRFRYLFKATTHEMASRFCFIDYDREMAIVAEITENEQRKLVGVGRLVADPDHHEAEYAILIADPWQGIGLGSSITDFSLDICRRWEIQSVVAEFASNNHRMERIVAHRGFTVEQKSADEVVVARLKCLC